MISYKVQVDAFLFVVRLTTSRGRNMVWWSGVRGTFCLQRSPIYNILPQAVVVAILKDINDTAAAAAAARTEHKETLFN